MKENKAKIAEGQLKATAMYYWVPQLVGTIVESGILAASCVKRRDARFGEGLSTEQRNE